MVAYIDTSAWIALLDAKDQYHKTALAAHERLQETNESLVTGWHTLIELTDGLVHHTNQERASSTLAKILQSPSIHVEPSEPHLERGLELFARRTDWQVDLSDCLSFALMESKKIQRAFTYDKDFSKAGFHIIH